MFARDIRVAAYRKQGASGPHEVVVEHTLPSMLSRLGLSSG